MNSPANNMNASSIRLLPHQAALVETFFSPEAKRIIILRGDVGLGRSTALLAVASRLLRERPKARVLIVVPGIGLRAHLAYRLREAGTPTLEVDRYRFREMVDSSTGGDMWPQGIAAVVTREFARLEDIRNSLASTRWDLLIVDEAHQFRGGLARDVVRHVSESSERIILSALPNVELPEAFPVQSATVVVWRRDQVVGYDGRPLDATPRPVLHEVRYDLSSTELKLAEMVGDLCRVLVSGTTQQAWIGRSWLRSVQSSPAALEARLPEVVEARNRTAHQAPEPVPDTLEDEEPLEDRLGGWLDLATAEKAAAIAALLVQKIEGLGSDSKLTAFAALLNRLEAPNATSRRICVLTEYVATLFYVAAEIEVHGVPCRLLHGSMTAEDRQSSLELFCHTGGVLAATSAALSEGIVLPEVTDLVLYDIPGSNTALQQVLGRFDRFGRRTQLNVYALLPSTEAFGASSDSVQLLRQVLGSASPEKGG